MIEKKFERCDADDPLRCQGRSTMNGGLGQCPFKAVPNSLYCARHGGIKELQKVEEAEKRIYRLSKWQARKNEFADHDQVKSLREEIGIARILLEETVNKAQDSSELLLYSSKISDLVTRIEKLVSSCHRLEASTGMLLDKTAAIHLASVIVTIIGNYITNHDTLDLISNEIVLAIVSQSPEVKDHK